MFINFSSSRPNFPVSPSALWSTYTMVFRPFNVCTIISWFTFSLVPHLKKCWRVCQRTERSRPAFILIYFFFKCCIIILLLSIERFNFIIKIRLRLKRFSFIISKYLYIYIFILYTRDTFSCLQAERRVASPFLNRRKFQWMRETDPHKFVVRWLKSLLPSNCTQTLVRVLRIPIRQRFFNRENSIIDL